MQVLFLVISQRPAQVRRHPPTRHSLDAQRFGAAQRPWRKKRQRDSQTLCRQQSRYYQLRRRDKDRSQHERRLRLHRKLLLRPWRRQHPVQLQGRQTGKRPQHCRPDVPPHLRNHSPSSGEIPKRSGTDFQEHPHPSGSSQRNVEKGRPVQTAQIRPCRSRPQDPALPQTRQTE